MWTMLVGMLTWFMMIGFIAIWKIAFAAGFFVKARKHGMKAVHWAVAGLLLDIWTLIAYNYAKLKISNRECGFCGALVEKSGEYCTNCGKRISEVDDGKIAKKFVLGVTAAVIIISIICGIWSAVTAYIK